ncbi:MAG: hypothetical protein ACKVH8_13600 [Pirellulales bacterium]
MSNFILRAILCLGVFSAMISFTTASASETEGRDSNQKHSKKQEPLGNLQLAKIVKKDKHFEVGTKLKMQVICEAERKEPFARLDLPSKEDTSSVLGVHLFQHNSRLDTMKKGKKYLVDGLIVNQGSVCYNAFFVYVESFREIK